MSRNGKPDPAPTAQQVAEWLALLFDPGQAIEIRAPKHRPGPRAKAGNAVRRIKASDTQAAAREALRLSGDCPAVYLVMNGVDPVLLSHPKGPEGAKAADIPGRRWLLVDCDPTRPGDTSSTDAEKAAAHELATAVREHLRSRGWPDPILADSGNGAHLLYRLDLPNDDRHESARVDGPSTLLVKAVLAALAGRFDTPEVSIDRKVFDLPRLVKCYGTEARKGEATAERPHRPSRILEVPARLDTVTTGQLEELVADLSPPKSIGLDGEMERKRTEASRSSGSKGRAPSSPGEWTAEARALEYLKRCDPAISGQGGHDATFKVACKIGPGFDLPIDVACRLLLAEYNPRCVPTWSEREIRHKCESAYKTETRRGWLLEAEGEPAAGGRHASNGQVGPGPDSAGPDSATSEPAEATGPREGGDDPHRLARIYRERRCRHPDGLTLRFWQGEYHRWDDGAWRPVMEQEIAAELTQEVKAEFDRLNILAIREWAKRGRVDDAGKACPPPTVRKVTRTTVGNVAQAMRSFTKLDARIGQPSWLRDDPPFPADEALPARNALVSLPALVSGGDAIRPPTPLYFAPYALDYDFDASAPEPIEWLTFLGARPIRPDGRVKHQLWPDDAQSIDALQEWFGYCLLADTRHQKILVLLGPKRSGKGTIARVLRRLIGPENVVGPTLSGLAGNFGLASLIGKLAAIISDARLSGRADQALIVERLLSISGEDALTVDRKHLPSWTGKLPTRITIVSNEMFRLSDTSGALAGRLILLRLTRSFLGMEDDRLTEILCAELPGILLWAIEGWRRLRERGRFVQPESGREMIDDLEDMASPVGAFLRERCTLEPGREIPAASLYGAWKQWCAEKGRDHPGDEQRFGRDLHAVLPSLRTPNRRQPDGTRKRHYEGIDLASPGVF